MGEVPLCTKIKLSPLRSTADPMCEYLRAQGTQGCKGISGIVRGFSACIYFVPLIPMHF